MPKGDNQVHQHNYSTKWNRQDRMRLELDIIKELGRVPTVRQMQDLLFERTQHKFSTSIIHSDLKNLDTVDVEQFEREKNDLLSKINVEISIAHNLAIGADTPDNIRLQAMKTMTSLAKAKSDLLEVIGKITAERKKKIIKYEIYLGKPERVDMNDEKIKKSVRESKDVSSDNTKEGAG